MNHDQGQPLPEAGGLTFQDVREEIAMHARMQNLEDDKTVLEYLLSQIEPDSMKQEFELKKLRSQKVVAAVDNILQLADSLGLGFGKLRGATYCFNRQYWQSIDADVLDKFAGDAVEKLGMSSFDAQYYRFKEEICKQIASSATIMPLTSSDPVRINFKNGTYEINGNNRCLRKPKREDFLTYQLPFAYDPEAKCPLFLGFMDKSIPNMEKQRVLAEYLGYVFLPELKLEKIMLLYGEGANGKSVFHEVINALLGNQNIVQCSLENLTDPKGYSRDQIQDKLLNYSTEMGKYFNFALMKQLTSNEPVETRQIYKGPYIMKRYARLMFNCNELPKLPEARHSFTRRLIIVHFDEIIPPEQQDSNLANKIIHSELPGVFNWVMDGLDRLKNQGKFSRCESSDQIIEDYILNNDSVQAFLSFQMVHKTQEIPIPLEELYNSYLAFCREDGFDNLNKKALSEALKRHGFKMSRKNYGVCVYARIGTE